MATAADLANQIQSNGNITLATTHVSGMSDNANAAQNIADTANSLQAQRSSYGNAPGGTIALNENMLSGILYMAMAYSFRVSEIAGGSHKVGSAHYDGLAFDVDQVNGVAVKDMSQGDYQAFRTRALNQPNNGAFQVLGPGDAGHDTHIHLAYAAGLVRPNLNVGSVGECEAGSK